MENFEKFDDVSEMDNLKDLIVKYFRLQEQIDNPSRDGMIKALSEAQRIAHDEIAALEKGQEDIDQVSWSDIPDHDLYQKLPQYKQGLYNYAIKKVDEETFMYMLEECI